MGVEPADEATTETNPEDVAEALGTDDFVFVHEFNDEIGGLVEGAKSLRYEYVVGDVSDPGKSSNGHLHFDLVRQGSTVHCIRFGGRLDSVDGELDDGAMVAVKGDVSYYRDEARVSLIVEHVVSVGEGAYSQILEAARQTLKQEGLLAKEVKQPIPDFPRCVGIVTSATSDAREDAVTSIHDRHPGVDIIVADATVQGDEAMASIMQAIGRLDNDPSVEVIVVTRGGGAEKHLRVFNETPVCRVIHHSNTPVVVGIGHENDRTLADEVADFRVMTPTEVGEIVPRKAELQEEFATAAERLKSAYLRTVTDRLETLADELQSAYDREVTTRIDAAGRRLDHAFETVTARHLTAYSNRLDHALQSARQQHEFAAERARAKRRQRALAAALIVALLILLGYIVLTKL